MFSAVKANFILGRNSPVTYSVALAPINMYVIGETNLDDMNEQSRLFDTGGILRHLAALVQALLPKFYRVFLSGS